MSDKWFLRNFVNFTHHRYVSVNLVLSSSMSPKDCNLPHYIYFHVRDNYKYLSFKAGDHVRMSKYKNNCTKGYTQVGLKKFFLVKKVNNTVPWTKLINNLNGGEIFETFYGKALEKTKQTMFRLKN